MAVFSKKSVTPSVKALRLLAVFVACFLACMVLLFANVWIFDDLTGRYLNFVPWILLSFLVAAFAHLPRLTWSAVATALLLVFVTDRVARFEWLRRDLSADLTHEHFVRKNITVSPRHLTGAPAKQGELLLVAPPLYPWLDERLRAQASGQLPPHHTKGHPAYRNMGW